MKIAHVTSQLCRASAGLGAAVAAISVATQRVGNEVRVFGLSSSAWRNGDCETWSGAPAQVFETQRWSGSFGYAPGMLSALLQFAPDIVHLHGLWTHPSIVVHQWHGHTGLPYVVSAHGMLMPMSLSYNFGRKSVARCLFQDRVLHAAAILHSTSSDEKAAYRSLGFDNRLMLVPLGLQTIPVPKVERDDGRRRLLFLGRLHHQKGLDRLIEAWVSLEGDYPDWELSIVGQSDTSYVREIEQMKLVASGKRVSFVGSLYGAKKDRYVAGSDLFVMPSRSENFGLTVAESLMMEVPVIATKGTPWSGLVPADAGWWVDQGAEALGAVMREAMALSPAELQRKGRNGRRWIESDFSWPVIGSKWLAAYESLV